MDRQHKETFAAALGPMVVKMMGEVMALPDELRPNATAATTLETVDGHEWKLSVEWCGFTGPAKLASAEG